MPPDTQQVQTALKNMEQSDQASRSATPATLPCSTSWDRRQMPGRSWEDGPLTRIGAALGKKKRTRILDENGALSKSYLDRQVASKLPLTQKSGELHCYVQPL